MIFKNKQKKTVMKIIYIIVIQNTRYSKIAIIRLLLIKDLLTANSTPISNQRPPQTQGSLQNVLLIKIKRPTLHGGYSLWL